MHIKWKHTKLLSGAIEKKPSVCRQQITSSHPDDAAAVYKAKLAVRTGWEGWHTLSRQSRQH